MIFRSQERGVRFQGTDDGGIEVTEYRGRNEEGVKDEGNYNILRGGISYFWF